MYLVLLIWQPLCHRGFAYSSNSFNSGHSLGCRNRYSHLWVVRPRGGLKCFKMYQQPYDGGTLVLHMEKPRHRGIRRTPYSSMVRKWHSQDAKQWPRGSCAWLGPVPAVGEPPFREWVSLRGCEEGDRGPEHPSPEVQWIHSKRSITSVYLLLLFTALFPKWIVCLSKEHLPLLQSLVNKIIFAFPQICMSLISLAIRTQEPVQETHAWAHTSTPGKKPSQTNIIRIK